MGQVLAPVLYTIVSIYWETFYNPDFKPVEFDTFRKLAGLNSFNLTPRKWIDATDAIGIFSQSGEK